MSGEIRLASNIITALQQASTSNTKSWLTNYVKKSKWVGCKVPTIRKIVREQIQQESNSLLLKDILPCSTYMIQTPECDIKIAGIILLSEFYPKEHLATLQFVHHLDTDVFTSDYINNWCTSDFLAHHVLRKIAYSDSPGSHDLSLQILGFAYRGTSLWQRRCGIVTFVDYHKHLHQLPENFVPRLLDGVEHCLLASPQERFTQTACAWVLRYILIQQQDSNQALSLITKHGELWTGEAKKSLVEKLPPKHSWRKVILELGL